MTNSFDCYTFGLTKRLNQLVDTHHTHSTEARILEAAREEFLSKGMTGARMQDIANKAGINKAMLHYYFRSKKRLLQMVLRESLIKLVSPLANIWDEDIPFDARLRSFVSAYISTISANPNLPGFVISEMNRDPEMLREIFSGQPWSLPERMKIEFQKAVDAGEIKAIEPIDLMINIISLCLFPIIASNMVRFNFGLSEKEYDDFIERRKVSVSEFVLQSIQPSNG